MVIISKFVFDKVLEHKNCSEALHPWNKSCIYGNLQMFISCIKGSFRVMLLVYIAQLVYKRKKIKTAEEFLLLRKNFIKSVTAVSLCSSLYTTLSCFCSRISGGGVGYYSTVYIVPFFSGLSIAFESPARKNILMTYFLTMTIESLYRSVLMPEVIHLPNTAKVIETLIFMVFNSALMFNLLRESSNDNSESIWFYTPLEVNDIICEENSQQQEGDTLGNTKTKICLKKISKNILKNWSIGLLTQIARVTASNIKDILSMKFLKLLCQWKTLKLATFFGTYVGIFEMVRGFLYKRNGENKAMNDAVAGFLAGGAYFLSPNLTIMAALITVLIKLMGKRIRRVYSLPDFPYTELCFAISYMYLIKLRLLNNACSPPFIAKLLDTLTCNKTGIIIGEFEKNAKQYIATTMKK